MQKFSTKTLKIVFLIACQIFFEIKRDLLFDHSPKAFNLDPQKYLKNVFKIELNILTNSKSQT